MRQPVENSIIQLEIQYTNLKSSLAFYEGVFGWSKLPTEIYQYHVLDVPEPLGFGVALIPKIGDKAFQSGVNIYFECKNIRSACERVVALGGTKVSETRKIPPYGHSQRIRDPDGNTWGLFEPNAD